MSRWHLYRLEIGYVQYETLQGVSTRPHVLAVISQLRHILPQPLPVTRSRRHCSSPLRQHHAQATDALTPAPHCTRPGATGSSHHVSAHLHLHRGPAVIEGRSHFWSDNLVMPDVTGSTHPHPQHGCRHRTRSISGPPQGFHNRLQNATESTFYDGPGHPGLHR